MAKKLYYKIGEACRILGIEAYVLRYWETEFPFLNPDKSKSGQRVYGEKEIELIRRIKELLYDEGYTIAGAKRKLEIELETGVRDSDGAGASPAAEAPETKATAGQDPAATPGQATAEPLDTALAQEVEELKSGLQGALRQAREILELLGSPAS